MRILPLLCVFLIGACDTVMSNTMDRMRSLIDEARVESSAHVEVAVGANDLAALQTEMLRHASAMDPVMGALDEQMDRMARRCYGQGFGGMRAKHGELDGELAHHRAEMSTVVDLGTARLEVVRHGEAVGSIYGAMETALDEMTCD